MTMDGAHSSRATASDEIAGSQVFFRFRDANGREHIVNSEEEVPAAQRTGAQVIVLNRPAAQQSSPLDPKSVMVGLAAGVVVGAVAVWFLRSRGAIAKLLVVLACGGALVFAYMGLIRRSAGLGSVAPATPQSLVDDAKRAVESMNARVRERDEQIRRLQKEAK